jgi:hypothetical protein
MSQSGSPLLDRSISLDASLAYSATFFLLENEYLPLQADGLAELLSDLDWRTEQDNLPRLQERWEEFHLLFKQAANLGNKLSLLSVEQAFRVARQFLESLSTKYDLTSLERLVAALDEFDRTRSPDSPGYVLWQKAVMEALTLEEPKPSAS